MTLTHTSLSEILTHHVTLEVESIDRMYLNLYVPALQSDYGVYRFLRYHRGFPVPSSAVMKPISQTFIAAIETYAQTQSVPLITFLHGQRKDDIVATYRSHFKPTEGIVVIGKAQEKTTTFRTHQGHGARTLDRSAKLYRSTAMVNHYYFYGVDDDFGPFFLKFSSYFPYSAKLCFNGHEYAKRQLAKAGIAYEPLDNGFRSCADPVRLQAICNDLSAEKIESFGRKWLERVPHPLTEFDRAAGYDYHFSILQAEFSLTQVLDRPLTGRLFFENVIRENLDLGRPDQVQLIFDRRITRRTPGSFRSRVITQGVTPTLHINYKQSGIKQYHKENLALRTETTVNNPRDFRIGKRLINLPALREVGFPANRRLLRVQHLSHDCQVGEETFQQINHPVQVGQQRASALSFADPRLQALLSALVMFRLLPYGFALSQLREVLAPLLGESVTALTQGRMSYHLRRLRLHGLIARVKGSHRYQVTDLGFRVAIFFTRTYGRVLRPGMAQLAPNTLPTDTPLRHQLNRFETALEQFVQQAMCAA